VRFQLSLKTAVSIICNMFYALKNTVPSYRTGNGEGSLGEFCTSSGNREGVGAVGRGT